MSKEKIKSADLEKSLEIIGEVFSSLEKVIIGQKNMIEKIIIAFLVDGHVLLEGVPGLAKTATIRAIAQLSGLDFNRIQFTPDLLPGDILGIEMYNQKTGGFKIKKGPLFSNVILADEINRAPSKVQSALLQAMEEKQITIGETTFALDENYTILATQNPMEQEGTYPLPEAQLDRFLFKVTMGYPTKEEEVQIGKIYAVEKSKTAEIKPLLNKKKIKFLKESVEKIYIDEKLIEYIVNIIDATRYPQNYKLDDTLISFGASPRATLAFIKASKANALLEGSTFVKVDNIKNVAFEILRHRIFRSYEAEAQDITTDNLIEKILFSVHTP